MEAIGQREREREKKGFDELMWRSRRGTGIVRSHRRMNAQPGMHRGGTRRRPIGARLMTWVCLLALAAGCSPAKHYRKYHDVKSLCAVLSQQVKSGDSMEHVQSLLGPGVILSGAERDLAAAHYLQLARGRPQVFRDGIVGDDVFLGYNSDASALALQFRNGRLINFDPKRFETVPGIRGESP